MLVEVQLWSDLRPGGFRSDDDDDVDNDNDADDKDDDDDDDDDDAPRTCKALPAVLRLSARASQSNLANWAAGWSCATFLRIIVLHSSNEILTFSDASVISACS